MKKTRHPFHGPGFDNLLFDLYMGHGISPYLDDQVTYRPDGSKLPVGNRHPNQRSAHRFLIQDVPDYLQVQAAEDNENLKLVKVPQYQGYAVDLDGVTSVDQYLESQLSTRNRKNLRSKLRKLESEHTLRHEWFYGPVDENRFREIFDRFYHILKARFDSKRLYNRNLTHWHTFYLLSLNMIRDKNASLHVIYDGEKPIAFNLCFICGPLFLSYIETHDEEYSRFNMGDISMLYNLQFCLENGFSLCDLSKGYTYKKEKWCNRVYGMDYYILYDPKSISSHLWAIRVKRVLQFKQFLRDKGILGKQFQLDKVLFKRQVRQLEGYDWQVALSETIQ